MVPPLGLLHVATHLKNAGYEVRLKDAFAEGMDWGDYEKYIVAEKPEIFGIGGMTPVIDTSFKAIRLARPHVKHVIMGGPHMSLYRGQVFNQCPEVDFGVAGEGEETALDLISTLNRGLSPDDLAGVVTRSGEYRDRQMIMDIDSLPIPDRSMIPNHRYRYPLSMHRPVTTIFSSRGCPYNCTFCDKSTFGSTWRARSIDHVLTEIDDIVHRYRIKSFIFYDDLFTLQRERVVGICEEILKRGYKLDWKCEGRVNIADLEILKLMKRAGCSLIAYGVETANPHGLDYLNKNISVAQIENAFALTAQAGIRTMAYFILGIPVETYEEELTTIELARKIKATYAQFSILSPYCGTKIYEEAVQKGWYREIDAQNPQDKDLKRPAIISSYWDEKRMKKILKKAHRDFYMRPKTMARLVFSIRSGEQVMGYGKEFLNILSWLRKG